MIQAPQTIYEIETDPEPPATTVGVDVTDAMRLVEAGKLYLKQTIHVYAPLPGVDVDELLDN
jgi:hypothetical protein